MTDRRIVVCLEVSLDPPQANKCIAPPLPQNTDEVKAKIKIPGTLVYVYLAVQDSGPGLKPGDLALLFQRFQQGELPSRASTAISLRCSLRLQFA